MKSAAVPSGDALGSPPENIGDVLASIRRMIAQDDMPGGDRAARPRLDVADRAATLADMQAMRGSLDSQIAPGSREALLTNAQNWTRRQSSLSGPLRLQRSELVCQTVPAATDAVLETSNVLADEGSASAQETGLCQRLDMPPSIVGDAEHEDCFCAMQSPVNEAINLSELQNWAAVASSTLTETIVMEPAMNAYAPTQMPANNAHLADVAASGQILSDLIRHVIRQELSDPSGRMSSDLRAIILSEVARAISGEATFAAASSDCAA